MSKFVKNMMKFVEGVITVLFAISVILVVCQVFWRYVLRDPITWSNQISRALFCWMVYLGIPCLFYRNVLMSFDLVQNSLSEIPHTWLKIGFRILGLFFCVCWMYFSYKLCTANTTVGKVFDGKIPFIGGLPKNALYSAQPVCCALLFLIQVSQIIDYFGEIKSLKATKKEALR